MSLQVSTKFKELILGPYSFKEIFDGGCIKLFAEPQPATADLEDPGAVLAVVTLNGLEWSPSANGLIFAQSGPYIVKAIGGSWVLSGLGTGTAQCFRLISNAGDTGEASIDYPRIDGRVGTVNAEMILPSTSITEGQSNELSGFFFTIPPVLGA